MSTETRPQTLSTFSLILARLGGRSASQGRALDHAPTRRALSTLSREQLRDIGLEHSGIEPAASMEVEAGLMARLLSQR